MAHIKCKYITDYYDDDGYGPYPDECELEGDFKNYYYCDDELYIKGKRKLYTNEKIQKLTGNNYTFEDIIYLQIDDKIYIDNNKGDN